MNILLPTASVDVQVIAGRKVDAEERNRSRRDTHRKRAVTWNMSELDLAHNDWLHFRCTGMLPVVRDFTEGGINTIRAHLPSDFDDLATIASVQTRPNMYSQILSRRGLRSSVDCPLSASCFMSLLRM